MNNPQHQHMRRQPRWGMLGLVPIVFGVLWLVSGWNSGFVAGLLSSVPGVVFTGAGATQLIWPGDRHVNHYLTLGSAASVVFAVLFAWVFGPVEAIVLVLGGVACCLQAGYMALRQDAVPAAVPMPRISLSLAAKAALDEAVLAYFMITSTIPRGEAAARDRIELERLEALIARRDWASAPQTLHPAPAAPEQVSIERVTERGRTFEWLTFASGYEPLKEIPGTTRWQGRQANRQMYARVFRHGDQPRPWLMCIHGYRMGVPALDFSLFNIDHLHHELGLNLIMPILPLHGPRRVSRISGSQFLDGPLAHLFHAETQALWDLRRCLAWLRTAHDAQTIGTLGYSLGGYNAALLATFEPALACVIAGIPLTDMPAALWRHMPTADLRYIEACGLTRDWVGRIMAPVSPLYWPARVPHERRYIFAATGDQMVPPEQALALWRHWDEPAMHWYQGTHMSVRRERGVAIFIDQALRDSGLTAPERSVVVAA